MQEAKERKRILVIEDDRDLREAIVDKFRQEKFEVLEAQNGEEGLAAALREKPDLLIVDIIMPKMDGTEMLKKVRENEWGRNVPVMILTNISDAEKLAEALEIGVDEYLLKAEWKLQDVLEKAKKIMGVI